MTKESGVAVIVNLSDRCGRVYNNDFDESHIKVMHSTCLQLTEYGVNWAVLTLRESSNISLI